MDTFGKPRKGASSVSAVLTAVPAPEIAPAAADAAADVHPEVVEVTPDFAQIFRTEANEHD